MIKKIILVLVAVLVVSVGYTRDLNNNTRTTTQSLYKPADNPIRSILNIGNWGYWQRDNGESAAAPSGDSGGFYPRGTAGAIYLDGMVIGGYQNGLLKVSGQTHHTGTEPGYIKDGQHITKADDPRVRIYRIRKGWETLTADQVRQDAQEMNELGSINDVTDGQIDVILAQYKKDWEEWPTEIGAPFYDLNNNGIYEPDLDETPGIANADQVIWYPITDANQNTTSTGFYGTDPIGIEMQITLWAYNQPGGGLGQIVFKQIRIINKGDGDLTDAYMSLFSDPDLGDYADDLIGVDVDKSMMYVYNGPVTDPQYDAFGIPPPAAGYDFFAGPIVESPGDVAIFDLKPRPGYRNLPASSFGYYGDADNDDPGPQGDVEAAREYYNLMRGFRPFDDLENPTPWKDADGNDTKFPYMGDPVTGIGHLDSSPGDRRMLMNSGPFTLAEGDTQDIVVAVIGGLGDNNLSSITALRNNDVVAQALFDDLFASIPSSPPQPNVKVITMDKHIMLDWGSVSAEVKAIEQSAGAGYEFQGYNVWQLPTATAGIDQAVRIATFDKIDGITTIYGPKFLPAFGEVVNNVPIQFGSDVGLQRHYNVTKNHLTGTPLLVGSTYYFGVTAYNYNEAPSLITDTSLESGLLPIIVTLSAPPLDTEYGADPGDFITVTHSEGGSDGTVQVMVVDPDKLTGDNYEVFFTDETYYRDVDGIWKNVNTAGKEGLAKILDCSGSTITVAALASAVIGTYDLAFSFEMHCGSNWVDGFVLDFPDDLVINSWEPVGTNGTGGQNCVNMEGTLDATNTITWGNDARSEWGCIEGDIKWAVNVQPYDFPINVGYTVYDDEYDGTLVDAVGTASATELGYDYKTFFGWYVRNVNNNELITPHTSIQNGYAGENVVDGILVPGHEVGENANPRAEGMQFIVNGPAAGVKAVSETDADGVVLDANVGVYPASLGTTGYILSHRDHADLGAGRTHDRFDYWDMDDVIIDFSETSLCFSYSGAKTITETVSGDQSKAPYAMYRKKFPSGEMMRLFTGWWDTDGDGIWGATDPYWTDYGKPSYEAMYAWQGYDAAGNEIPYDPANDAAYIADGGLPNDTGQAFGSNPGFFNYPFVTATMVVLYLDGSTPPWGNQILITTFKPNLALDKFTFNAPAKTVSDALAKEAVKLINVFPNPYYASNSLETNRFDNFVTFTHLPQKAKIRIFSLDGKIVREYDKNTDSQYFKWDLRNHTDIPVASGVYIVYIDMGIDGQGLGEKILKVFIVQPNQVVKYY